MAVIWKGVCRIVKRFACAGAFTAVMLASTGAEAMIIDTFDVIQFLEGTTSGITANAVTGSGILGGERDFQVFMTVGTGISLDASGGILTFDRPSGTNGNALVIWGGVGGAGLGGADLTDGGTGSAFLIDLVSSTSGYPLVLQVYTDATHFSFLGVSLPGPTTTPTTLAVPFTTTPFTLGSDGPADFASVSSIVLSFASGVATLQFDSISTNGTSTSAPVPEPGTLLLLGSGLAGVGALARRRLR